MNVELVNPFITSILQVLDTYAKTSAQRGKPFLKTDDAVPGDITGLVDIHGTAVHGSLAYHFSREAMLTIASRALDTPTAEINDAVRNVFSEITRNASGDAQKSLVERGFQVTVSPHLPADGGAPPDPEISGPTVIVPFQTGDDAASFFLEFCLNETSPKV